MNFESSKFFLVYIYLGFFALLGLNQIITAWNTAKIFQIIVKHVTGLLYAGKKIQIRNYSKYYTVNSRQKRQL